MADAGAPEVGAQRRLDQGQQLPQHPVFRQVADFFQRLLDGVDLRGGARLVAMLRIEAQLEQAHQHPGDARMRRQRRGDGGLRLGKADLLEVLGIGPQHHDVFGRQRRQQHQPVEVVAFHVAAQHLGESVLEQPGQDFGLELARQRRVQFEVVQRDRLARPAAVDLVARFGDHAQAHVFEHRQAVGQHQRSAAPIDLQAERARVGRGQRIERQRERCLGRQRLEFAHVGHGIAGRNAVAVGRRERRAPALEERPAGRLALGLDQGIAQFVIPAARGRGQLALDLGAVELGNLARRGADREVDARQRCVAQRHIEVDHGAAECPQQDALELDAQVRGEGLARHVHQAGDEALERVAPDKQPQPLAFAERHDAQRRVVQDLVGNLEQRVARKGFQDVVQRLGQMAPRRQPGPVGDRTHLAAQQRRLGNPRAVGGGREESDEAVFAGDLALVVVALDADVVGVAGPVHGGTDVGLGHDQHRQRRGGRGLRQRRQGQDAGRQFLLRGLPQQAQPASAHQLQRRFALFLDQVVLAVAQQGHVVVAQPFEKGPAFGDLGFGYGRRCVLEVGDGVLQPGHHGFPVFHRGADIVQHALDARRQRIALLRVHQPVDFQVHPRLARHPGRARPRRHRDQLARGVALDGVDRMHQQMQGQALPVDLQRGGVHQERHVVVDDLDRRVARAPAVLARRRTEDADLGAARLAHLAELQVRQQRAQQVLGCALGEVLRVQALEIFAGNGCDQLLAGRFQPRGGQGEHGIDAVVHRLG